MYKGPNRKFKRKVQGKGRRRLSEFGIQLLEKQKLRAIYGLRERNMRNYYLAATKRHEGDAASEILTLLERRLDSVVYRIGFATTRFQARQIINHGHIFVNGHRVNIPSFQVKKGDTVSIREQSKAKGVFKDLSVTLPRHQAPAWLALEPAKLSAKVAALPTREFIQEPVDPSLVVEFYNR